VCRRWKTSITRARASAFGHRPPTSGHKDNEEFRARLAAAYQEIEQLRQRLVDVIGTSGVATPG